MCLDLFQTYTQKLHLLPWTETGKKDKINESKRKKNVDKEKNSYSSSFPFHTPRGRASIERKEYFESSHLIYYSKDSFKYMIFFSLDK